MLMLLLLKSVTAAPLDPPDRLEIVSRSPASVAPVALMMGDMVAEMALLMRRTDRSKK